MSSESNLFDFLDPFDFGTLQLAEGRLSWTVPGLADLQEEFYESPPFSLGLIGNRVKGCMGMWPNGSRPGDEGYISVRLWWWGSGARSRNLRYQISLVKDGRLAHSSEATPGDDMLHRFIRRAEVYNDSGLLCNGQLTFYLKFWHQDREPVYPQMTKQNSGRLTNDPHSFSFKRWYQDRNCTDITVKVQDKGYRAHKFVLASRSRVFYTMFTQDMSEVNTNSLDITDMTAEGFEHLLEYMYTGNVADMNDFASELLHAAEKYDLGELKAMCVASLHKTISEDSVLNTFALADLYKDAMLKNAALEFIKHHARSITALEEWKTFVSQHSELVTDILLFLARTQDPVGDDPPTKKTKIN